LHCHHHHRVLHSFPTRRSSDLGGKWIKKKVCQIFKGYIEECQKDMIAALKKTRFHAPGTFENMHKLVHGYLGDGNKMGEGWLLTDRKSTRLNSSHVSISYAVFC